MSVAITLNSKRLWIVLQALEAQIHAEQERSQSDDPGENAAGDFGNDVRHLEALRDELLALQAAGSCTAIDYQCWSDPADNGLVLLRAQDVQRLRDQGQFSERAELRYAFIAHSGEEAMAIHALRQGWAPYRPMGAAGSCPNCHAAYYPEGYGDCWRCGHIG